MANDAYNPGMPISFSIPLDIKAIDVMFWMRPFTVDTLNSRYRINYPYATLYIQKVVDYNARKAMDPAKAAALSFAVNQDMLESVKDMFREAMSWFSEENLSILYGKNDDGLLLFNSEYQKLNAIAVNEYGNTKTALKITPTVVEIGNGVTAPGVVFYINLMENAILLREYELRRLGEFILDFNFIPYTQFAMQCFQYSLSTGSLLSREQVQKRLDSQRQYNTNFRY